MPERHSSRYTDVYPTEITQEAKKSPRDHLGCGGSHFGSLFASEGGPAPRGKEANRNDERKGEAGRRVGEVRRAVGPVRHEAKLLSLTSRCCQAKGHCMPESTRQ